MSVKSSTVSKACGSGAVQTTRRVSARALLMAGVTAVGIATAVPNGAPVVHQQPVAQVAAAETLRRVSTQEVHLTAYVPGLYEVGAVAEEAVVAVDSLLTAGMDVVLAVTSRIPLVSALAPQISYVYFCVLRSFVYAPLIAAARFAKSLDFGHIVNAGVHILDRLSHFVKYEIDYFLNLPRYLLGFEFLPDEFRPGAMVFSASSLANVANAVDPGTVAGTDAVSGVESDEDVAPIAEQGGPGEIPATVDPPGELPAPSEEILAGTETVVEAETSTLPEDIDLQIEPVTLEDSAAVLDEDDSEATITDDLPAESAGGKDTSSSGDTAGAGADSASASTGKTADGASDTGSGQRVSGKPKHAA